MACLSIKAGSSKPIKFSHSAVDLKGYFLIRPSEIDVKMKIIMKEAKSIRDKMLQTQNSFFVLYQGVNWRFSQMMSDGSEAGWISIS